MSCVGLQGARGLVPGASPPSSPTPLPSLPPHNHTDLSLPLNQELSKRPLQGYKAMPAHWAWLSFRSAQMSRAREAPPTHTLVLLSPLTLLHSPSRHLFLLPKPRSYLSMVLPSTSCFLSAMPLVRCCCPITQHSAWQVVDVSSYL